MWFDVGIKRYTTGNYIATNQMRLWFDVGIKRYTTSGLSVLERNALWFDVGIKRYTTLAEYGEITRGCGLM